MKATAVLVCLMFFLQNSFLLAQTELPSLHLKQSIPTGACNSFAFGNRSDVWATNGNGFAHIYDGSNEKNVLQWGGHSPAMRFSQNDDSLWSHDVLQDVNGDKWRIPSQAWDLDGRGAIVSSCYPDGESTLVGYATYRPRKTTRIEPPTPKGELLVIDLQTGRRLRELKVGIHREEYLNMACDGDRVAVGLNDTLFVWNWRTGETAFWTYIVEDWLSPFIDFSSDGKHLVLGTVDSGEITVWETEKWTQVAHWTNSQGRLTGALFLPDNKTVALSYGEGGVSLWNSRSGKRVWQSKPITVHAIALHPRTSDLYLNDGNSTLIYQISGL